MVWLCRALLELCDRLSGSPGHDLFAFKETAFYQCMMSLVYFYYSSLSHASLPSSAYPNTLQFLIDQLMEDFMLRLAPRLCNNYGLQLPVQDAGRTAGPTQHTQSGGGSGSEVYD